LSATASTITTASSSSPTTKFPDSDGRLSDDSHSSMPGLITLPASPAPATREPPRDNISFFLDEDEVEEEGDSIPPLAPSSSSLSASSGAVPAPAPGLSLTPAPSDPAVEEKGAEEKGAEERRSEEVVGSVVDGKSGPDEQTGRLWVKVSRRGLKKSTSLNFDDLFGGARRGGVADDDDLSGTAAAAARVAEADPDLRRGSAPVPRHTRGLYIQVDKVLEENEEVASPRSAKLGSASPSSSPAPLSSGESGWGLKTRFMSLRLKPKERHTRERGAREEEGGSSGLDEKSRRPSPDPPATHRASSAEDVGSDRRRTPSPSPAASPIPAFTAETLPDKVWVRVTAFERSPLQVVKIIQVPKEAGTAELLVQSCDKFSVIQTNYLLHSEALGRRLEEGDTFLRHPQLYQSNVYLRSTIAAPAERFGAREKDGGDHHHHHHQHQSQQQSSSSQFGGGIGRKLAGMYTSLRRKAQDRPSAEAAKVYLSMILTNSQGQHLVTENGLFPSVEVGCEVSDLQVHSPDFIWLVKRCLDWRGEPATPVDEYSLSGRVLRDEMALGDASGHPPFRLAVLKAVSALATRLGVTSLGALNEEPIYLAHNNSYFLTWIQPLTHKGTGLGGDWERNGFLRWRPLDQVSFESYQPLASVWRGLCETPQPPPLSAGLYLTFFSVSNAKTGMHVVTMRGERSMIPYIKIRGNHHLNERERAWLLHEAELSKSTYAAVNHNSLTALYTPKTPPTLLFQSPIRAADEAPNPELRPHEDLQMFQDMVNLARQYLRTLAGADFDVGQVIIETPFLLGERQDVQIICLTEPFQALEKRLSSALVAPPPNRRRAQSIGDSARPSSFGDSGGTTTTNGGGGGGGSNGEPQAEQGTPEAPKVSPYPLSLFEAQHQHLYSGTRYTEFRRRMEQVEVALARRNLEIEAEKKIKAQARARAGKTSRRKHADLDSDEEDGEDDNDGWGPREKIDDKIRTVENQLYQLRKEWGKFSWPLQFLTRSRIA